MAYGADQRAAPAASTAASAAAFTPYHSQYLAHRITLEGVNEDAFAKSL